MGSKEKLVWAILLGAGLVTAVILLALGAFVVRYRAAADYPGAELMAGQDTYAAWPNPTLKRDTSYLSNDPFPAVYNFYSAGFGLGPEAYAQSNCIQMARSFTDLLVIERHMSVMLCDTPRGRMIFVMRAVTLRLPH
ncbi:MAG: hypothetical protein ABI847_13440 [Anaerolineales bacterium]